MALDLADAGPSKEPENAAPTEQETVDKQAEQPEAEQLVVEVTPEADIPGMWTIVADDGSPQRFLGSFSFQDRRGTEISLENLEKSVGCTCSAFLVRPDWETWYTEFGDSGTPFDESDAGPSIKVPVKTWCVEYRDEQVARIWFTSETAQYCLVEGPGAPRLTPEAGELNREMRKKV